MLPPFYSHSSFLVSLFIIFHSFTFLPSISHIPLSALSFRSLTFGHFWTFPRPRHTIGTGCTNLGSGPPELESRNFGFVYYGPTVGSMSLFITTPTACTKVYRKAQHVCVLHDCWHSYMPQNGPSCKTLVRNITFEIMSIVCGTRTVWEAYGNLGDALVTATFLEGFQGFLHNMQSS